MVLGTWTTMATDSGILIRVTYHSGLAPAVIHLSQADGAPH